MLDTIIVPLLALPRILKRAIAMLVDVALCTLAIWVAYYLRLGDFISLNDTPTLAVIVSVGLSLPIFAVCGLYRAVLRYAGSDIVWATARACAAYGTIYATIFTAYGVSGVPRTIGIIQPLLLFAMVFLSRASASYWLGGAYRKRSRPAAADRTMIYGAGMSGR